MLAEADALSWWLVGLALWFGCVLACYDDFEFVARQIWRLVRRALTACRSAVPVRQRERYRDERQQDARPPRER